MLNKVIYEMNPIIDTWPESSISFDCVIFAETDDERTKKIKRFFKQNSSTCQYYRIVYKNNKSTLSDLEENTLSLTVSITNPSNDTRNILKPSIKLPKGATVGLDITGLTKPYIFAIFKYLASCELEAIHILYTEPMRYKFDNGAYMKYNTYSGPLEINEIPGYPGRSTRKEKHVLVVLLGFDGETTRFVIDNLSPEVVIFINGFPSYNQKYKDVSLVNNEKVIQSYGAHQSIEYTKANNPFDVYNTLHRIVTKYPKDFITIAPLGTKPMALGACMYALQNQEVRIIYPMPEEYKNSTTEKVWLTWEYQVIIKDLLV